MCCNNNSNMIRVSAFDGGDSFIINADHIVKIVVPEEEIEEIVDGQPVKKRVIVDGTVIVLSSGQAHRVKENMSYFVRLFFDSNDDSV